MVNLIQFAVNPAYRSRWHLARKARQRIFDHPLARESTVIDCGAHKGNFAREIIQRFGCRNVVCFEPIEHFASAIPETFRGLEIQPRIINVALGRENGRDRFHLAGDATGAFVDGPGAEVTMVDAAEAFVEHGLVGADLLAVNVEGGEYDLLDRLIETGHLATVRSVMVQFHTTVPEHQERYDRISDALETSHRLDWRLPWAWECWRLIR